MNELQTEQVRAALHALAPVAHELRKRGWPVELMIYAPGEIPLHVRTGYSAALVIPLPQPGEEPRTPLEADRSAIPR